MATTKFLNSARTVWVTTYWGGTERGTCFDISMQAGAETQVTRTFDVAGLLDVLRQGGRTVGLAKPDEDDEEPRLSEVK